MSNRRWPIIVAALLGAHVLGCLVFMYLATSDPSLAVEEDYYQKGLAWDEHQRQAAANAALGWQSRVTATPAAAPGDPTLVRLALSDREGRPVGGARVAGEAFAVARSATVAALSLPMTASPGLYEGPLAARRGGQWELRLEVQRGADRFTLVERITLPPPPRR